MARLPWFTTALVLSLSSCNQAAPVTPEKPRPGKSLRAQKDKPSAEDKDKAKSEAHVDESGGGKFGVPFVWENSRDEPLALTRAFLREAFEDNLTYMEHGPKFFEAFANVQLPRATIVTCADSRVQASAWDVTPENDDFTIRNVGNQIQNAEGSVEYGVEQLRTPLLLVIGHTGCGAVKAAMGDISKVSPALQNELKGLKVGRPAPGKSEEQALSEGVVANVQAQVAFALQRFGRRVQTGQLTVIGAIYDLRNEFGQGPGKLVLVDVNGNTEAERMESFIKAVKGGPASDGRTKKAGSKKDADPSIEDTMHALSEVQGIVTHEVVSTTGNPLQAGAEHTAAAPRH